MAILTRLPLQRRIMALVAGGLGLTLLGVALIGAKITAQSTERILQERLLLARVQAAHLDERLAVALARLEGMSVAGTWDLARGLSPENLRLLGASATRPGLFSGGFFVGDAAGRIVWPQPSAGVVLLPEVLPRALAGQATVSGLVRFPPRAFPAAVMAVPLRGGTGRVTGVLGGVIDLRTETLTSLISLLAFGRTGHAVIVDHDGVVLAGTEAHERFTRGDHPDFFASLIKTGQADIGRTPEIEDGKTREMHVMAFAPLSVGQWGLGFGQSEWEVFLHERHLQRQIFLLGLAVLVVGIWFGWRDAGSITAPLRRLTAAAQRIAGGDLANRIAQEPGHEVGLLAGALETMRANLARMRDELQQRSAVIERQGRQSQALYEVSRAILSEADLTAVLSTIASSAQSLLGSDVAAVCLWNREHRLTPGAFAGPAEAFASGDDPAVCEVALADGDGQPGSHCPFIRAGFREMHVTATMRAGDQPIGYMCIGRSTPGAFKEEDAGLLTALSSLAAIAIQSAQLREQVQHLAVLEERERISRDLHDSIIQSLYGISLALEHCQQLIDMRSGTAVARLDEVIATLTRVIGDVRVFVMDLHPDAGEAPLAAVLERVVGEFRVNTLLPVELRARQPLPDLEEDRRRHLQLLLREALGNVARHAAASHVVVETGVGDGEFRLTVTDDGRGFDPTILGRADGMGLRTMAERARRMGGTLDVRSRPGGGTTLEVRLPLPVEEGVG